MYLLNRGDIFLKIIKDTNSGKMKGRDKVNKIINYKKYDTDTAESLGSSTNGLDSSNFYYVYEELFIKKTGEYFLYVEGGRGSKYGKRCGNMYLNDKKIIPYTEEEAKVWAMENLDGDIFEQLFGEVQE